MFYCYVDILNQYHRSNQYPEPFRLLVYKTWYRTTEPPITARRRIGWLESGFIGSLVVLVKDALKEFWLNDLRFMKHSSTFFFFQTLSLNDLPILMQVPCRCSLEAPVYTVVTLGRYYVSASKVYLVVPYKLRKGQVIEMEALGRRKINSVM